MRKKFISFDNKEFDDEKKCYEYEKSLQKKYLENNIIILNEDLEKCFLSNNVKFLVAKNFESVKLLDDISASLCSFELTDEDLKFPIIFVKDENDYPWNKGKILFNQLNYLILLENRRKEESEKKIENLIELNNSIKEKFF